MDIEVWRQNVREYWKTEAVWYIGIVSQRILGSQPGKGFPMKLWWFCFGTVLIGLAINGVVLTSKMASTIRVTSVDRNTSGAICTCNALVPNNLILQVYPNQTAFEGLPDLYNSSLILGNIWNSGQTFLDTWTVPIDWNSLAQQNQNTFHNQLLIMQTTIQLTLILFANGTSSADLLSQIAGLEISLYSESFIYEIQPVNPKICPTAVCLINSYPGFWDLIIEFLTVIVSSNLIVYLVMFIFSSLIWNIVHLRKPEPYVEKL